MTVPTRLVTTAAAAALLAGLGLVGGPGCGMASGNGGDPNNNNPSDAGGCYISLDYSPLNPRVGDLISVDMYVNGGTFMSAAWTVLDPFNAPVAVDLRNDDRTAEFVPAESGTYAVSVDVTVAGNTYCPGGSTNITVAAPNALTENVTLMLTPSDLTQAPQQQENLTIIGQTPRTDLQFQLEAGTPLNIELEGPNGPIDGYVRLTPVGSNLHQEGFYSTSGNALQFRLFNMATYDVLVVPDTDTVAPAAMTGQTEAQLTDPSLFILTRGEPVQGWVVDPTAQGLADARVVLRCNDVPSGVGVTGIITGTYALYARPGTCTATVVPPDGSQWPELFVPETTGIEVAGGTNLELAFGYRALTFRTLSGQVTETGGATPVDNARITLISDQLTDVADLTITGDGTPIGPVAVSGRWRGTAFSNASGGYQFLSVPAGTYTAIIEPPQGAATLTGNIDLTAGDLINHTLQRAQPALLKGTVYGEPENQADPLEADNVRVVAVTDLGTGSAVETITDSMGYFELPVVDGATYTLRFIPQVNAGLAWLVGLEVEVQAVQGEQEVRGPNDSDLILPRGLRLSGEITGPGSGEGVLLQVFCQNCGHINPLAETFTNAASIFVLIVPDPGIEEASP